MEKDVKEKLLKIRTDLVDGCSVCDGRGYIADEVPCQCMLIFQYIIHLTEARIPEDYWALSLDNLEQVDPEFTEFVGYYCGRIHRAAKKGLGILFLGSNGIGKTSMMCEIGKEAIVQGYKVRYLTAHQ